MSELTTAEKFGVIELVELSQRDYVRAFGMQRDPAKRQRMKQLAYYVMYGGDWNLTVKLSPDLIPFGFRPTPRCKVLQFRPLDKC